MICSSSSEFILAMMRERLPALAARASARISATMPSCMVNGDCISALRERRAPSPVSCANTLSMSSHSLGSAVSSPKSVYRRAVRG
ncbi:hypothetical protein D3C85_1418360 [compost metagenome]